MGLNTMPRQTKKRKGGAEKQREKKARQLLEDATKCHILVHVSQSGKVLKETKVLIVVSIGCVLLLPCRRAKHIIDVQFICLSILLVL